MAAVLLPARRTRQQAWSRPAARACGRGCRSLLPHSPPFAFACGGSHSSEHHPGIVGTVIPGVPLVCPHPTSSGFPPPALPGPFGATHLAATRPSLSLARFRLCACMPAPGLPVLQLSTPAHVPPSVPRRNRTVLALVASGSLAACPVLLAGCRDRFATAGNRRLSTEHGKRSPLAIL